MGRVFVGREHQHARALVLRQQAAQGLERLRLGDRLGSLEPGKQADLIIGSLLIGILQTLPLTVDKSLVNLGQQFGWTIAPDSPLYPVAKITLAQTAPILPYLLLVLILIFRPRGLLGQRED